MYNDARGTETCVKPPTLDRKTSWPNYKKLFEAVAKTNCWAAKKQLLQQLLEVVKPWMCCKRHTRKQRRTTHWWKNWRYVIKMHTSGTSVSMTDEEPPTEDWRKFLGVRSWCGSSSAFAYPSASGNVMEYLVVQTFAYEVKNVKKKQSACSVWLNQRHCEVLATT